MMLKEWVWPRSVQVLAFIIWRFSFVSGNVLAKYI